MDRAGSGRKGIQPKFKIWNNLQGVPKKCPGHICYFNDNLIYAHLHRLPHVRFATFFLLVLNIRYFAKLPLLLAVVNFRIVLISNQCKKRASTCILEELLVQCIVNVVKEFLKSVQTSRNGMLFFHWMEIKGSYNKNVV